MDYHVKLDADMGKLHVDVGQYRRLVGKLIYLTVTRSDITYAVAVSQFMQVPRQPHCKTRNLRYLKGALGESLLYKQSHKLTVVGFNDADWTGHSDRSISGYCTLVIIL